MFKKSILSLSVCTLLAGAQSAMAYEAGDVILKGGAAILEPNDGSGTIRITDPGAAAGDTGVAGVGVGSNTQLGLSATYMYTNNIGVEVLAATPFEHDITLDALNTEIASTKHLPPTVTLNWYLNDSSEKFQPFVGAGLNYTVFFDEKVTPALDAVAPFDLLASLVPGGVGAGVITSVSGTNIELDDSFGLALHAGFDYAITDNIGITASYYRLDIDTEAEITTQTNAGTVKAVVDVNVDPSGYLVGLSYKF